MRPAFLALSLFLAAVAAPAQFPPSQVRPRGVPQPNLFYTDSSLYSSDALQWAGPLVPMAGADVYRTFGIGATPPAQPREIPGGAAVMVGYEVTIAPAGRSGEIITSFQAFYLANGRRLGGQVVGQASGARTSVFARDGYVLHSLQAAGRDTVTGLTATFARLQADGTLSESDTYTAAPTGAAGTVLLSGGGLPIIGVSASGQRSLSGLALLVSKPFVLQRKAELTPRPATATAAVGGLGRPGFPPAALPPVNPGVPPSLPAAPTIPGLPGDPAMPAAPAAPAAPNVPVATILEPTPFGTSPAPAVAPAVPDNDARIAELMQLANERLFLAEGTEGSGSAFACIQGGRRYLYTNQHVVSGNPQTRFNGLVSEGLRVGPAQAAVGHDIIRYQIDATVPAFELLDDYMQNVRIGDDVVVLGNTEGARVIKPLAGRVLGLGPNLVEISAPFLPGNSGSPIVHLKTGRVIGIATYAVIRSVNSLTGQQDPTVRRFGYRLDSVAQWQDVAWPEYQAEAAAMKKVTDFSGSIIALFQDLKNRKFNPANHPDSRLRPALMELEPLMGRSVLNASDQLRMVQKFLGAMRNVVQKDVQDLQPRLRYDFYRKAIGEEVKFRDEIYKGLGESMQRLNR